MKSIKEIVERLHMRFEIIWGDKHTSRFIDERYLQIWIDDWCDGLRNIDLLTIKDAIDYCKLNLEWPPSLAEFIKLCDRSIKIPSPEECLQLAVRRDFSHPLVKTIFNKIGSWDMGHEKESILLKRFKQHHKEELENFRTERQKYPQIEHDAQGSDNGRENKINYRENDKLGRTDMRKATDYLLQ